MKNIHIKTERSGCLMLFGLPFFLVGAGFLVMSVIPNLYDGWRMQSWHSTQARLTAADLIVSRSSDSTTYRVEAEYEYNVAGKKYNNNRVAIGNAGDNIGDFQETLGRRLEYANRNHQPVNIWYDPDNPQNSVINRDIRWGLFGFKMIFVLVFGGVGLGLLYFGFRGKRTNTAPEVTEQPWLKNPDWKDGAIRSSAKSGMIAIWAFAAIWNMISAPLLFQAPDIWQEQGAVVLLALLFPIIGIGMLYWAIKLTLEWRRFGRTPLKMDPFPGSIGGDVAGEVTVNMPYDPGQAYEVTLSCLYSYVSGSGKNRSRHESVKWQDSGYARPVVSSSGVKLQFRFEVPTGLHETDNKDGSSYHLWRLNVRAELEGVDLDRDFEIPVYATSTQSKRISLLSTEIRPAGKRTESIESILPVMQMGRSTQIHYPMFRKPLTSLVMLLFGAAFAGVGFFLWGQAAKEGFGLYLMSSVFGLVGWGIVLAALYSAMNSLTVTLDGQTLQSQRSLLGIPLRNKTLGYTDVLSIERKEGSTTQKGKRQEIDYSIVAKYHGGEVTLAENINSHSKAGKVVDYFEEKLTGKRGSMTFEL
ncbi:MAG: DUF3592 domain-containing protein [Gammaproteobacteria bacterium]|nr:MAG: DUF3592 domain-containing protein [Gammaproteobacteria bacterium]